MPRRCLPFEQKWQSIQKTKSQELTYWFTSRYLTSFLFSTVLLSQQMQGTLYGMTLPKDHFFSIISAWVKVKKSFLNHSVNLYISALYVFDTYSFEYCNILATKMFNLLVVTVFWVGRFRRIGIYLRDSHWQGLHMNTRVLVGTAKRWYSALAAFRITGFQGHRK